MDKPRFSVAMCTHNGAAFLREQLLSIAAQSMPVQELVICDDCSTDTTYAIVEDFSTQHPGLVRFHRNNSRLGYTQNFAQAISLCQGNIIFLSDHDDVWLPARVAKMAALFDGDDQCGVVSVAAIVTDRNLRPNGKLLLPISPSINEKTSSFSARIHRSSAYGCTLAFRASVCRLIFPISPHWGHDNWICFIASRFTKIRGIEEPLMLYRRHPASAGMNDNLDFGPFLQLIAAAKRSKRQDYEHDLQKWHDMNQQLQRIFDSSSAFVIRDVADSRNAILDEVRARLIFSEERLQVTSKPRVFRLALALQIFLAGKYDEFASGWKSFMKDLLIA